jgi:Flp pilus assembly pilin Flp
MNIARFLRDEGGATLVEYGTIAALLGVTVMSTVSAVADAIDQAYEDINCEVDDHDGPCGSSFRAQIVGYAGLDGMVSESEMEAMIADLCPSDCPTANEVMSDYGSGPWSQEDVYDAASTYDAENP